MFELDYTNQGRKPSVGQIIADWKRADKPVEFCVMYGETYAHFVKQAAWGAVRWIADGNGCSGVKRDQVEKRLNEIDKVTP